MINPVLCVTFSAVMEAIRMKHIPDDNQAYSLRINDIDQKHFHFLNRSIADSNLFTDFTIAKQLPQVLPYVMVICGDEVLTYSRAKGQEDRLHGKLSCGFGGHVDISDIDPNNFNLTKGIMRELLEELRLDDTSPFVFLECNMALIDQTNEVGKVHLGYVYTVELSSKDMINPDLDEIHLPEWKTFDQLNEEFSSYENWSQTLIRVMEPA